jgi:DNA-directed RNA polymerase subunit alpha
MKWKALQMPERVTADESVSTERYGRFVVEPLERGFGLTLGNALRRVLLSSLQGVAVTALRIMDEKVRHEFATIPGVLEDVTDIVLNLKQIRFKHLGDGPRRGLFRAKGKTELKAGDLEISTDIKVLNPELHIATVNREGDFQMEVEVTSGKGYLSEEQHNAVLDRFGWIPVDSVFSPVTKVNFTVENTRIGQRIDFDKLVIEVWTNGTLSPREAVSKAARLLRDQLAIFDTEAADEKAAAGGADRPQNELEALLDTNVEELELSVRSANCLKNAGIRTLRELVQRSEKEMLETKNFGRKSLNEIKEILREKGLAFGMKFEAPAGAGR